MILFAGLKVCSTTLYNIDFFLYRICQLFHLRIHNILLFYSRILLKDTNLSNYPNLSIIKVDIKIALLTILS